MKKFRTLNNSLGWLAFAIAAATYCLTAEPTASFWDCPEFILSAHKLEINHPPGAPFFMLTANFFSLFAEPENVAYMVNIMSAVLSAAGIMFLFWSITHLARKLIVGNSKEISMPQTVTILAAGMVGALAYTWSDTYWFSAVEGEVYGYSSLFTAVVFWLILKWEDCADSPHSDRWLVLIAYLVGLSIGVHLLNLLCIPAIVLVAYYRKFPNANWKGMLLAMAASGAIVFVVLYGIVPGVVKVGGWSELLFVNVLGMPFNTGLFVYIALLAGTLIAGLFVTEKGGSRTAVAALFTLGTALLGIPFYGYGTMSVVIGLLVLAGIFLCVKLVKIGKELISYRVINTIFLCMFTIMIGYASYALIVIRSAANTPMDQNSPEDIFTLGSYLNREQYGSRPLFYGPGFDSEIKRDENGSAVYKKTSPVYTRTDDGKYLLRAYNIEYLYEQNMLFPRMYSSAYADEYENCIGGEVTNTVEAKHPEYRQNKENPNRVKMPTQWDNLKFLLGYQTSYMYWRYFAWNFTGRQNDIQANGDMAYGNCITGIPPIDGLIFGDREELPTDLRENKGYNNYYALPLILGIIGLFWQARKGREGNRQLAVTSMLFFMTGIAIVLYLNQVPGQARERDYSFAASFYAFAIWIGLGAAAIIEYVQKRAKKESIKRDIAVAALCLIIPFQMLSQTWDDHNRSGRYACRDFGQNYLNSLSEKGSPILFTYYDNDSYPLWYCQGVEGTRTDARTAIYSFITTPWHTDQLKQPAYDAPAIPITWDKDDYKNNEGFWVTVLPWETKPYIDAYIEQYPEMAKLLGDDPFSANNVTRLWVQDAVKGEKSAGRTVVEEVIDYARARCVKEYGDSLIQWNKQIERYTAVIEDTEGADTGEILAARTELKKKSERASSIIHRMQTLHSTSRVVPSEIHVTVDSAAVAESGLMQPAGTTIPEYMCIDLSGISSIPQLHLFTIDIIENAGWNRPIYMTNFVMDYECPHWLKRFFVQEGLVYRVTPFDWSRHGYSRKDIENGSCPIDIEKTYSNIMDKFKWGGIKESGSYYADPVIKEFVSLHHSLIATAAEELYRLIQQSDEPNNKERYTAMLIALLEKQQQELPAEKIPISTKDRKEVAAAMYKRLMLMTKGTAEGELMQSRYEKNIAETMQHACEYYEWYKNNPPRRTYWAINNKRELFEVLAIYFENASAEDAGKLASLAGGKEAGYFAAEIIACLKEYAAMEQSDREWLAGTGVPQAAVKALKNMLPFISAKEDASNAINLF